MVELMVCEECGHEQPDMGVGVVCEMCGGNMVPKEEAAAPEQPTDKTDIKDKTDGPVLPPEEDMAGKVPPMREIVTHQCGAGMDEALKILVLDEPGPGNACHRYSIGLANAADPMEINFQKGAVAEAGPNGISCESLLAVVIDRLEGFQSGPYPCEENRIALDHCQRAIRTLHKRTIERAARNVEGQTKT